MVTYTDKGRLGEDNAKIERGCVMRTWGMRLGPMDRSHTG